MTLTSRSLMLVVMVQHKTSDQYLTSGKVSTWSIHRFKRYRLLKTLTKNFNILSNADADVDADADAMVTAIALPVLTYRRAKTECCIVGYKYSILGYISIIVTMIFHFWKMTYLTFNWHYSAMSCYFFMRFSAKRFALAALSACYNYTEIVKTLSFDL